MPALSNPKHEAFCQAYVRGQHAGNGTAAYVKAFKCAPKTAGVNACKLLKKTSITSRIAELQAQVAKIEDDATAKAIEKLAITKERVLRELSLIGFANMLDYVRVTEAGDPEIDLSRLERDTAAAVQEVTIDSYQDGRGEDAKEVKRIRFKLGDKRAALVDMGKHLGLFVGLPPPAASTVNVTVKAELVDRPPRETFKQWEARRAAELAGKQPPRKPEKKR